LSVYSGGLELVDSESFNDSYTLNFHMQALAKKHRIGKTLLVIHDKDRNAVELSVAQEESLFFVS
jgi:hypothetical protein